MTEKEKLELLGNTFQDKFGYEPMDDHTFKKICLFLEEFFHEHFHFDDIIVQTHNYNVEFDYNKNRVEVWFQEMKDSTRYTLVFG